MATDGGDTLLHVGASISQSECESESVIAVSIPEALAATAERLNTQLLGPCFTRNHRRALCMSSAVAPLNTLAPHRPSGSCPDVLLVALEG